MTVLIQLQILKFDVRGIKEKDGFKIYRLTNKKTLTELEDELREESKKDYSDDEKKQQAAQPLFLKRYD